MNRNHMLKRKMTAGLAVGMAVAVGSVPMAIGPPALPPGRTGK